MPTMKDPTDSKTADMHPVPKRRGRPPTGTAKTPAQRKQIQRERDRTRLAGAEAEQDALPVTVTGMVEAIGRAAAAGNADLIEHLARELAKRVRVKSKPADLPLSDDSGSW